MIERIKIGVSRCLLGDAVRYDGQSKPCALVIDKLAKIFELIPICPEVEAGLPIPRPPVQLSSNIESPRLIGRDDSNIDITDLMHDYCKKKIPQLNELHGFVLKSRSPSCGLNSTPVFINDSIVSETASGIFAMAIQYAFPNLPVIDELQLNSPHKLEQFLHAVSEKMTKSVSS